VRAQTHTHIHTHHAHTRTHTHIHTHTRAHTHTYTRTHHTHTHTYTTHQTARARARTHTQFYLSCSHSYLHSHRSSLLPSAAWRSNARSASCAQLKTLGSVRSVPKTFYAGARPSCSSCHHVPPAVKHLTALSCEHVHMCLQESQLYGCRTVVFGWGWAQSPTDSWPLKFGGLA